MLKKTIKFQDLEGNEVVEDFYFNLSKAEVTKMQLSYPGGLAEHLQDILDKQDGALIITTFERFIKESYGKRSENGRGFIKNLEVLAEFVETDAYSEMFMELCTDAKAGAEFVRGIMPNGENLELPEVLQLPETSEVAVVSEPTKPAKDPSTMTREELLEAFKSKNGE